MKHEVLSVTSQALAITSQLLAIGIEVSIIAGGIYIYKKMVTPAMIIKTDENPQQVDKPSEKKSWKEKWQKVKKIVSAVIEE